jgi:hypothetical protein
MDVHFCATFTARYSVPSRHFDISLYGKIVDNDLNQRGAIAHALDFLVRHLLYFTQPVGYFVFNGLVAENDISISVDIFRFS